MGVEPTAVAATGNDRGSIRQQIKDVLATGLSPAGQCLFSVGAAALILLVRKFDSFSYPQFWAEDGTVFFAQQFNDGAASIWRPYAGYLHLVPRLTALVGSWLMPPCLAPHFYNYTALVLTLATVAAVFSPRLKCRFKPLMALSMVLVSNYGAEVFMNITNIQWILSLLVILTVIKEAPDTAYGRVWLQVAGDLLIVLICGLTGPFMIFAVPLFAFRAWHRRSRHSRCLLAAALITAGTQAVLIASSDHPAGGGDALFDPGTWIELVGRRLAGNMFFGKSISKQAPAAGLAAGLFGVLGFIGHGIWRAEREQRRRLVMLLLFAGAFVAGAVFRSRLYPTIVNRAVDGPRYFYVPYVMLSWLLIGGLADCRRRRRVMAGILLLMALGSSLNLRFVANPFYDFRWQDYCARIGREELRIPINPGNYDAPLYWCVKLNRKGDAADRAPAR